MIYLGYKISLVGVKKVKPTSITTEKRQKGLKEKATRVEWLSGLHLIILFETSAGEDRFQTEAD